MSKAKPEVVAEVVAEEVAEVVAEAVASDSELLERAYALLGSPGDSITSGAANEIRKCLDRLRSSL